MKKNVLFLLLFVVSAGGAFSQDSKTSVLVLPPVNRTTDDIYNNICSTVEDLFSFTLGLLGEYEVLTGAEEPPLTVADISAYAGEQGIDRILFGDLTAGSDGSIVISMSLYEKEADRVVARSRGTSYSLLEVFDVTDDILVELMKQFSDINVGFGSLTLVNEGEEGAFQVFLDGRPAGDSGNLGALKKVLNKEYQLEIRQRRFGFSRVIHSSRVVIEDRKDTKVTFAIPYLTEGESSDIEDIRTRVENIIADNKLDTDYPEGGVLETLIDSMGGLEFCPALAEVKESLTGLLNDFKDEMVLRDAIVHVGDEGDRVSWSGYMKRLSSEDPTRQAYINMAEFVYVVKTVEAVKRWEKSDELPGLDHYQNGYLPGYTGSSSFLIHAEKEQEYINSIFTAYYTDTFKDKTEVKTLIRKHYGKRLIGTLEKINTTFYKMNRKRLKDLKSEIEALEVPVNVVREDLRKFSIEPFLSLTATGRSYDDNSDKSVGMFGAGAGFGMILTPVISFTVESGVLMTSFSQFDSDTGDTLDEGSPALTAIPFGARIIFGNRRNGFAGGIGFNYFMDLPSGRNDILMPFMPELTVYYRKFFAAASFWGGDNNMGGVGIKFGYVFR